MKLIVKIILFLYIMVFLPSSAFSSVLSQNNESITILGVGDINLGGSAKDLLTQKGYGFAFKNTKSIIVSADIAIANLESAVTDRGGEANSKKKYNFRISREALEAISDSGFDIVSLANNHIMDFGNTGFFDTIAALEEMQIKHSGAGKNLKMARSPAIVTKNRIKVGFLSYSLTFPKEYWAEEDKPGTVFGHEKYVRKDVKELSKKTDLIVVGFHWGEELRTTPKPYQMMLGHAAIEEGAAIVFGHHPHVLQGVEWYKNGIIFYSLGNFSFGSYSEKSKTSIMATVEISKNKDIKQIMLVPIDVYNKNIIFNPTPTKVLDSKNIMEELKEKSSEFKTEFIMKNNLIEVVKK